MKPIAISMPNWPAFTEACTQAEIDSPVRRLDKEALPINDPGSYLGSLSMSTTVREALRHDTNIRQLLHITFMAELSDREALVVATNGLTIHKFHTAYLISGTFDKWISFVVNVSQVGKDRHLSEAAWAVFNNCGLRDGFYNYTRTATSTGTKFSI